MKLTQERNCDKKVRLHVKKIRDHVVKNFMQTQLRVSNKSVVATSDTMLKECIAKINHSGQVTNQSTISPFYLTGNESQLQMRSQTQYGKMGSLRIRPTPLYTGSIKKVLSGLPQPKNKLNHVLSSDKLSRIRNKYRTILRQSNRIQQYSRSQCNRFKKDWKLCERILREVNRGQEKFEDPTVNFDYYIWQASKLCSTLDKEGNEDD